MRDIDRRQLRDRLDAELAKAIEAIQHAQQSAATVELDQSSVGRISRIDALQQQALAQGLLERLLTRQRKLNAALDRFDSGIYGLCCACEANIEPERLNADPTVVFCQGCAVDRQQ